MTVRRSAGTPDTYPGGPRALARELNLPIPGGVPLSYADVEDAAVRAFSTNRGQARLVIGPAMPVLPVPAALSRSPARARSASKARPSTARQRGTQR